MRFAAAFMVMAFHLGFWSWAHPGSSTGKAFGAATSYPEIAPLAAFGWVGVQVFFVISGAVIAQSANGASPGRFLSGRMVRLYPAAWFCASATALVLWQMGGGALQPYLRAMALSPLGPWVDGVYWTLAVEVQFYAVVFLLLCFGAYRALPWLAALLILAAAVFVAGFWADITLPLNGRLTLVQLGRYAAYFGLGIYLWLGTVRPLRRAEWALAALALVVGAAEIALRVKDIGPRLGEGPFLAATPVALWLAGVAAVALTLRKPFAGARWAGALRTAGLMTYPLYLIHNVAGAALLGTLVRAGVERWSALALAMLAMIAASWAITLLWERPVQRRLRQLLALIGRRVPGPRFLSRPGGRLHPAEDRELVRIDEAAAAP